MAIPSPATQTADKLGLCFEHRHTRDEPRWPGGQRYVLRLRLPHKSKILNSQCGSFKAARLGARRGGARRSPEGQAVAREGFGDGFSLAKHILRMCKLVQL